MVSYQMNGEQVERALDTAEDLYEYLMDDYNYQVADTAEIEEFNKISVEGNFFAENEDDVCIFRRKGID